MDFFDIINHFNGDHGFAFLIALSFIVNKSEMWHKDVDLSQCKIWLEISAETDNMTYAKFVTEKSMDLIT